ncbi:integrator complex subunit 6-like isoform X1 [Artemia franciscana]|uniref:integrator complex subunit 6-like isoform X1 n=1 Tax=Artemia franciscana TaxID=6661 RepID=UPI0032DA5269
MDSKFNPFMVARENILDSIMRQQKVHFCPPPGVLRTFSGDSSCNLPINKMGNYQEYLKKLPPPLREIEPRTKQYYSFANPFKTKVFIDEADTADKFESEKNRGIERTLEAVTTSQMTRKTGIKRGPLPKDFVYKKSSFTVDRKYGGLETDDAKKFHRCDIVLCSQISHTHKMDGKTVGDRNSIIVLYSSHLFQFLRVNRE